jgi:hypothetical protein
LAAKTPNISDALVSHTMPAKNKEPYQQAYYPPVPTAFTRYMRTSVIWQFIRFWIINFKIFKLLLKSHH